MEVVFKLIDLNFPLSECVFGFGFLLILIVEQFLHSRQHPSSQVHNPVNDAQPLLASVEPQNPTNYGSMDCSSSHESEDPHVAILSPPRSIGAFILLFALSLHSIFEGIAIGLQKTTDNNIKILIAVLIHKCVIALTLSLAFVEQYGTVDVIKRSLIFSFASPSGILIGSLVVDLVKGTALDITSGVLQGIAAGTFLHVTIFEVLQKELDGRNGMLKVLFVVLGYVLVGMTLYFWPDDD